MPEEILTSQIKSFLREHVASLEHLVILLLLYASDRNWTVTDVYGVIKSSNESVANVLTYLRNAGFIIEHEPGCYEYRPASDALRKMIAAVSAIYKTHRIRVIEFIYSAPSDPITEFSNAFRLRRDK